MRSVLVAAAGASASVVASLLVLVAVQNRDHGWVEVVDNCLVRTSATEMQLNGVVESVLDEFRPAGCAAERLARSEFTQHASVWFSEPDLFGQSTERVRRLVREQRDGRNRWLRVEQLSGEEMPTLVFIRHDGAGDEVARRLAARLEELGYRLR